jgi:sulfur carrier protein
VLIVLKVQVKLFATFRNGRRKLQEFEYPHDIPISTVLKDLSLSKDDVGMALVNGIRATNDIKLHDHDVLALVPEYKTRHH